MSRKEKIFFVLILFFFFTLFFARLQLLNTIATVAVVAYSLLFNSINEKWQLLKRRRYLQGMLLFFAWVVVSVALSKNHNKAMSFLDPRLALLYLPISIGTLTLTKRFKDKVLLYFAALTTAVCIFCFAYALQRSHFFQQREFLYNDSLTEILGQQSIYISLLVNVSIYIFGYFIFIKNVPYKGWMLLAVLFLFGMSYLLASRNLMVVLYAIDYIYRSL